MGTLKTTNIESISGSGTVTLGTSGETFTVPTGVTISGGLTNTPVFAVTLSGNQSLSNETETKVTFDTEAIDSDSAFASNKFTVPAGKAGKYLIQTMIEIDTGQNANFDSSYVAIKKNGSNVNYSSFDFRGNASRAFPCNATIVIDLAAADYLEVYTWISAAISASGLNALGGTTRSSFKGYKLT